jgi:putative transposase
VTNRHLPPVPTPTRKPLRLAWRDYALPGMYFVTIVTHRRACLFGSVVDGAVRLNAAGRMASDLWDQIPSWHVDAAMDAFIVMPNHVHGIITLRDVGGGRPSSLASVVGGWKSRTTLAYGEGVRRMGWRRFGGQLWHRGFYDHVVRDRWDLERIQEYIRDNPARWCVDRENPEPGV